MNTKTMRLPPRRVLTTTKRKERDDLEAPTPTLTPTPSKPASFNKLHKPTTSQPNKAAKPDSFSNHLLAGYLAHEYLTKGSLFGHPFDPARSQAQAQAQAQSPSKKMEADPSRRGAEPQEHQQEETYQKRYVEVASLLKTDGAHIPGVINPTQLARFLQM